MKNLSNVSLKIFAFSFILLILSQISVSYSDQTQTQEYDQIDKEVLAKVRGILDSMRNEKSHDSWSEGSFKIQFMGQEAVKYLSRITKYDKDKTLRWMAAQEIRHSEFNYLAYDLFIRLINERDLSVQWQAINALGDIGDARAVPVLLDVLKYPYGDAAENAAEALSEINDESAIPELIRMLNAGKEEHQNLACRALYGTRDKSVIPFVIKAFYSESGKVRKQAAFVLREAIDERSVPALIEALVDDESKDIREIAREALVRIGTKSAILYLIKFCNIDNYDRFSKDTASLILKNKERTREFVIEALMHPDADIRKKAAWLIGRMREKSALPMLLELLKDDRTEIKLQVIKTLLEIEDKSVVPALIEALKDDSVKVKVAATKALSKFGDKSAIQPLLKLLKKKNTKIVKAAINTLGKLKAEEAFDELFEFLQKKNKKYIDDIIYSLGLLGNEKAVPYLIKELQNKSIGFRTSVIRALVKIGSKSAFTALTDVIKDESKKVRYTMIYSLEESGSDAVPLLIQLLDDQDEEIAEEAIRAIHTIGYKAIPELIEALRNEHFNIRKNALKTLAIYEDYSAEPELIRLLNDDLVELRIHAAEALCNAGTEIAVEPLISALKDENHEVRANSAKALGRIADVPDITELIKLLQDEEPIVREEAAKALGKIQDETAVPELIKLLNDDYIRIRHYAIEALGMIADVRAEDALMKSLKDESVFPRGGGPCGSPGVDFNFYLRSDAAEALGLLGSKSSVPLLIELLKDKVSKVRDITSQALSRIGDKRAIEPLGELLLDESYDINTSALEALKSFKADSLQMLIKSLKTTRNFVRSYAASALIEIGDKSIVPELIKSIDDGSFTTETVLTLIALGDKDAVPYIIKSLNIFRLRTNAAKALARIKDERAIEPLQYWYKNSKFDSIKVIMAESLYNLNVPDKKTKLDFVVKTLMRYKNNEDDSDYSYSIDTLIKTAYNTVCRINNDSTTSILIELAKNDKFGKQLEAIHELKKRLDKSAFKELYEKFWSGKDRSLDMDMGNIEKYIEEALNNLNDNEMYEWKTIVTRHYPKRESAINFLGNYKVKAAVPWLIESLEIKYEQWRGYAVDALGEIGDKSAIEPLKKLFAETRDKSLKIEIATALYKLESDYKTEMVEFILKCVESRKYSISGSALHSFGELRLVDAVPKIIEVLKTKRGFNRDDFIETLGKIGDKSALPTLKMYLDDNMRDTREAAADGIAAIEKASAK